MIVFFGKILCFGVVQKSCFSCHFSKKSTLPEVKLLLNSLRNFLFFVLIYFTKKTRPSPSKYPLIKSGKNLSGTSGKIIVLLLCLFPPSFDTFKYNFLENIIRSLLSSFF